MPHLGFFVAVDRTQKKNGVLKDSDRYRMYATAVKIIFYFVFNYSAR